MIKAAKNVHIDDEELPVDENGDEIVEPDPPHFPSLVSHVCKRWRQIALDTGKLWSTIDFHEGPPYEKTREWLVRSKDSPNLELILDVEDPVSKLSSSEKLEEVLVLIEPHAPRISSLYARTSTIADLVHVLVHLTDTTNPLPLKSLALLVDEVDSSLMDHQELQGKQLMLRDMLAGLEELELEKVHLPWSYITLRGLRKLRLSTLNVDGESPTAQHIYQLLTDCPQIEMYVSSHNSRFPSANETPIRINLDGVDIGGSDALMGDGVPSIKLPHLSDLFLTQLEWSPSRFLLSIIDAPHLSYLRIVDMELLEDSPLPRKLISNFFNKISPTSLRTIRVEETQFGDSDLMGMISASRALQELHIVDCAVTNRLLTYLEGAAPLLDSIKLDSISSIDSESLKKFVTARQASDHPLKQIAIKYCRIEPEVHEWLASMVHEVIWETDSDASGSDIDDELEGAETTDGEDVLDVDMIDGELDEF